MVMLLALVLLPAAPGPAGARTRPRRVRRRAPAAAAPAFPVAATARAMDALLSAALPPTGPGGAVLVRRGARVLVRRGYGRRAGQPVTPATPFPIGAVGEQMVAAAVLQLAADGRLDLGDPIARHVRGAPAGVTVEQLLTHTSGLADAPDAGWCASPAGAPPAPGPAGRPPRFAPGADWAESSADYALLARAVETVSGEALATALRRRLFEPLGMTSSGCGAEVAGARVAAGPAPDPATGLISSVDDLGRWCAAEDGDAIVRHDLLERAFTPTILADGRSTACGYGLGLSTLNGHATLERAAGGPGFSAALLRVPDQRVAVAVLCDGPGLDAQRLALQLAGMASGSPWAEPSPIALEAAQLDRMTGAYAAPGGDGISITRQGARLFAQRGGGARVEIVAQSASTFFVPDSEVRYEFTLAPGERASRLSVRRRIGPAEIATRVNDAASGR